MGTELARITSTKSIDKLMSGANSLIQIDGAEKLLITHIERSFLKTPDLANCNNISVANAISKCLYYGFYPDIEHAALVPFKNECTLMITAKGARNLFSRTGVVRSITAHAVHEGDEFEETLGLNPNLIHKVSRESQDEKEITHFYAVITFTNDAKQFRVVTRKYVDKVMNVSRNKQTSWSSWYERMGEKTAINRLAKDLDIESMKAMSGANADGITNLQNALNDENSQSNYVEVVDSEGESEGVGEVVVENNSGEGGNDESTFEEKQSEEKSDDTSQNNNDNPVEKNDEDPNSEINESQTQGW